VDGKKLSDCTTEEIAEVTPYAQEAFLTQLFEAGFFHADPHPGTQDVRVPNICQPCGLFLLHATFSLDFR
jgi:predicted unusual protein kinase regulating ubiquinone biosynthesis (AarF/ABC1/UbiB family)